MFIRRLFNYRQLARTTSHNFSVDLMKLIHKKMQQISIQHEEIEKKLNDGKSRNPNADRKKLNKLQPTIALFEKVDNCKKILEELDKMKQEENDKETKQFLDDQEKRVKAELLGYKEDCLNELVEPAMYDDCDDISMEMRPGVGGSQSSLFVQDVSNMFLNYFQRQGWSCKITESQRDFSIGKGYKFFSMRISGPDVYKTMKCQSGVHKVIRVPETESRGRLHSSTITVAVMPTVPFDFVFNQKEVRYDFMRAQGAGGQHVNKTQSACRATHIPTGLSVFIQEDRVQERNRKKAVDILKQKVFEQQYLKNMEQEAQRRKIQIGSGDRSEKIRTYNFQQDRITDHRTGLTLFGIQKMLNGEYLQRFIQEYQTTVSKLQMEELLQNLSK